MHIDLGPARSWGSASGTSNSAYPRGFGEPDAQTRRCRSRGRRRGVYVEVAEGVISETQGALQPLIPYLDTLRWPFIGLALVGIGAAIYAPLDDWGLRRR
jgi:zinc D-Ala-D-Ala carboxypeptidase